MAEAHSRVVAMSTGLWDRTSLALLTHDCLCSGWSALDM